MSSSMYPPDFFFPNQVCSRNPTNMPVRYGSPQAIILQSKIVVPIGSCSLAELSRSDNIEAKKRYTVE